VIVLPEDSVFIKFESKNSFIYYVGLVLEMEKDELKIMFARKKLGSSLKFVFPDVDDITQVDIKDVKLRLPCPTITRNLQHQQFTIVTTEVTRIASAITFGLNLGSIHNIR